MAYISHSILIVTADGTFGHTLHAYLATGGYTVQVVDDVPSALHTLRSQIPSLLLIDRRVPAARQLLEVGLVQNIRHLAVQPPGSSCDDDQCAEEMDEGFDLVICGESYRLIWARIKAILRSMPKECRRLRIGEVIIDIDRHEVTIGTHPIYLTRTQYKILEVMCQQPMRALSRHEIVNQVWGHHVVMQEHTVDVHIHALRRKLERHMTQPGFIQTIHGFGFRLRSPSVFTKS